MRRSVRLRVRRQTHSSRRVRTLRCDLLAPSEQFQLCAEDDRRDASRQDLWSICTQRTQFDHHSGQGRQYQSRLRRTTTDRLPSMSLSSHAEWLPKSLPDRLLRTLLQRDQRFMNLLTITFFSKLS